MEISLAEARVSLLQRVMEKSQSAIDSEVCTQTHSLPVQLLKHRQTQNTSEKMVVLLREYIAHLQEVDQLSESALSNLSNYYMPSELISASEWADFENVYQAHAPNLFMCDSIRDVSFSHSKKRRFV